MSRVGQRGYVLYTVVIMLTIVAATALLVRGDSSFKAGVTERDFEIANADYIVEAVMQHALWQKDNYGCAGDLTITRTASGSHKYTAVIDSAATSTSKRLNADRDTWIKESAGDDNFGSEVELSVKKKPGDSFRSLYHYDLSSMGARYRVQSAIAWFYVGANDDKGPLEIHAVTADWTEFGATWNNTAAHIDTTVMGIIPTQSSSDVWVSVDITALAQQWANDPASNKGIMLVATADDKESKYASRENAGSQKPYLEITTSVGNVSPVSIEANVNWSNGVTRSKTLTDVPVYKSAVATTLQPNSVEGIDASIWNSQPDTNFGDSKDIWVSSKSDDASVGLFKFNLRDIPAGVRVLSARLSLKRSPSPDKDVTITAHRAHSDWDENFVTWNQRDDGVKWKRPGGDYGAAIEASTIVGNPADGRFEWEISDLVDGWLNGEFPNYGVILQTPDPGIAGIKLDSSDHGDSKRLPGLTIEYACECGTACVAPRGSGRILMVVGDDPLNPSAGDVVLHDRFEEWGYSVSYIKDDDIQANFEESLEKNDAVFVSPSVDSASVGSKVTNTLIGVVNAKGEMNDELGFAAAAARPVGSRIEVVDVDHYITSVFPLGSVIINSRSMEGLTASGIESPEAQRLAEWGGAGALLAMQAGDAVWKGGRASGRRVMVPLGRELNSRPNYWSNSGSLIVQRALAWATDADVAGRRLMLVVGSSNSLSTEDAALVSLLQSWGYTVRPVASNASQDDFESLALISDVVVVTESAKANQIGTKLTALDLGIVLAQTDLVNEFGIADGVDWSSGTDLNIDSSYFVTSPLPDGQVTVLSSSDDFATLSGGVAPDVQVIGEAVGNSALVALETGAETLGGSAAGRRILLPWSSNGFDVADLSDSGLEILERAVRWAADSSGTVTSVYTLSTDKDAELSGLGFKEEDLVVYTPWDETAGLFLDGEPVLKKGKIDALHILEDGQLLLSTKGDGDLGGLIFKDGDLIRYDAVEDKSIRVFEGATLFGDDKAKISSVHLLGNGHFVLSTDKAATLGGLSFTDRDLVEYDPQTDTATLFFDASETTLNNKITGVHVLPNGHLVLSSKGATTLGGVSFDAADLIDYDPVDDIAKLIFDGSELFKDQGEKINSVHIGPGSGVVVGVGGGSCDGSFRDDFNSISFAGNDGSLAWAGDWMEVGESDGASAGDIEVANDAGNYQLLTSDNDNGGEGVARELDLSGASSATLSYKYRRDLKGKKDYTTVEVRDGNLAAPWTELARHRGKAKDKKYQSASHDISSFTSSRTQIRIKTAPTMGGNEEVWFDDVQIVCSP